MKKDKVKHTISEKDIIEAAKKNPDRFAPLYNVYYKPIFIFIFKKTRDEELTADITSRVFLKALLNIKSYTHMGFPFSSWLYRIASNEVNMHFRKANKVQEIEINERTLSSLFEVFDDVNDKRDKETRQQLLIDGLNQLSLEQMELIDLRFFEQYSFKEIGHQLDITEGNAKIRVYRALDKLKKLLDQNV